MEALRDADRESRERRARRVRFLEREFGPPRGMLFYGGLFAARAYEEAKLCYVNACFVGCVVLCQMVVEHSLAAVVALNGREELSGTSLYNLLREALRSGYIDQEKYEAFDAYRTMRNAYVHNREDIATIEMSRRAGATRGGVLGVWERDALLALRAMRRIMEGTGRMASTS